MTDLVPNDLLSAPDDSTFESRKVLDDLAAEINSKTNGTVEGEVRTSYPYREHVRHQFTLRARRNYGYDLFDVVHSIDEYPVTLRGPAQGEEHRCNSRDELEQVIKDIFAAQRTRKLIKQLAQMDT